MERKDAFIVGNGVSRVGFTLETLKGQGTVYGCNALYRDFDPDWLVAIDDKIITEIEHSNFPSSKFFAPPEDRRYEPADYRVPRARNNAGMVAMELAIEHGQERLFCLGFDFLIQNEEALSNVYDGTNAYGPETRARAADNVNRFKYLNWFTKKNSNTQFVFVIERKPMKLLSPESENVEFWFYDQLVKYVS